MARRPAEAPPYTPPTGMSEIVTFARGDRFQVGTSGSLVIAAWHGEALPGDLDVVEQAERHVLESSDVLNLVMALKLLGTKPTPEIKARGEQLQRDFADHIVGQAVVLVGPWALAASIVTVTAALNTLRRAPVWTRTFRATDPALGWLAGLKQQLPQEAASLRMLQPAAREFTAALHS